MHMLKSGSCRGFDPVAPVIHEWTYEAMVYDLLSLNGNAYEYESQTEGGQTELKVHILDERDPLWTELRHQHFADASLKISSLVEEFTKKNKTASYARGRVSHNPRRCSYCTTQQYLKTGAT